MRRLILRLVASCLAILILSVLPKTSSAADYWLKIEADVTRTLAIEQPVDPAILLKFRGEEVWQLRKITSSGSIIFPSQPYTSSMGCGYAWKVHGSPGAIVYDQSVWWHYSSMITTSYRVGQLPDPVGPLTGPTGRDSEYDQLDEYVKTVEWTRWFWMKVSIPEDRPPVAVDQTAATVSPVPAIINLERGATGGPATAGLIVTPPPAAQGSVRVNGLNAVFTPAATFGGPASFTFKLSNAAGTSNTATARVAVTKPFEVRTLNPFWTYPYGSNAVALDPIRREINSPGSAGRSDSSGPAVATKIASDGVSRLIVGLRTYSRSTATVSLASGSPGSLVPLNAALFAQPAGVLRSIPLSSFTAVAGGNGALTGGVVYVAPETPKNSPAHKPVIINVTQDGQTKTITLDLVPPPVLLVHGIWSGPDTWAQWYGPFGAKFPNVDAADYSYKKWVKFDDGTVQHYFRGAVTTMLDETRRKGVVAAQLNLVGHSMGGLVSRVFANRDPHTNPQNFYAGYINAIVTVDSVHRGTPLADVLWAHKDDPLAPTPDNPQGPPSDYLIDHYLIDDISNPTLAKLFETKRMTIAGAVNSLRPHSPSLDDLNDLSNQFPYEAVAAYDDFIIPSAIEQFFNKLLRKLNQPTVDQIFQGDRNDVLVSVASQTAGSQLGLPAIAGLIHANLWSSASVAVLNSPKVITYVSCRLLKGTSCVAAAAATVDTVQTERVPVDGFSLAGLTRVSDSTLILSGVPSTGLLPNVPRALTPRSTTRTLTHFLAMIDDGTSNWFTGDNVDPKIRLTATSLKPIIVRVVAAFSDRTYATRSWTLRPSTAFTIRALRFNDSVIRVQRNTTYPLKLVADLNAPATGSLDVTPNAVYAAKPGASGIARVSTAGILTAVAPGTMWVSGSYKGRDAYSTIIVSP